MPPSIKYSKEKILDVCLSLVNEKGIDYISARNIASELGCSICPVFSHFENMDVLKEELLQEIFKIYEDYINKSMIGSDKPFKAAGMGYIKFAKEYNNYFKVLFMSETKCENVLELLNVDVTNNNIMEKFISNDVEISKKIHKYCWLFVHGIAVMVATGYCSFSDEEISEMLTYEYEAIINKEGR